MKVAAPKVSCPVCWGRGKWPAISDRNWFGVGATRTPDYIQSCPFCCGTGEVKAKSAQPIIAASPEGLGVSQDEPKSLSKDPA
jgi:hypothetical protein